MSNKFIVVDMTHDGHILCSELKEKADQVFGVDIYNTMIPKLSDKLLKSGVQTVSSLQNLQIYKNDIVIAPVHCPPFYLKKAKKNGASIISHHQMVGSLLKDRLQNKLIIEITGVKGKTTTTSVISQLLAHNGRKVLSLTSSGLSYMYNGHQDSLNPSLNITPASLIQAIKTSKPFDTCVFEISLGGTGLADIGIITSLIPDYLIANKTKKSSSAKAQMLKLAKEEAIILINSDYKNPSFNPQTPAKYVEYGTHGNICLVDYRFSHFGSSVSFQVKSEFFYNTEHSKIFHLQLQPKLFGFSYIEAIMAGIGTCLAMNFTDDAILEAIDALRPLKGRLELSKKNDTWIIKDINSGVSVYSIEYIIKKISPLLGNHNGKIWLIVGIQTPNLCEKIDRAELLKSLECWQSLLRRTIILSDSTQRYQDVLNQILSECKPNDIILICIKARG